MRFASCLALVFCLGCVAAQPPAQVPRPATPQPAAIVTCQPMDSQVLDNGCELECDGQTATITCPVHQGCPNRDGEAVATVFDYTTKPPAGEQPVTKHVLKSKSPCGCVTKCEVCDCIPNGTYAGTCKNMVCTYSVPCKPKI